MSKGRVPLRIDRKFSATSEKGKLFGWLRETYDDSMIEMVLFAVKVLYEARFLSATGESEEDVMKSITWARQNFEEYMRMAQNPFSQFGLNGFLSKGHAQLRYENPLHASTVKNLQNVRPIEPNLCEPTQLRHLSLPSEDEDEFVLDESKIFDETNNG